MRRVLTTMAVGVLLAGALLPTGQAQAKQAEQASSTKAQANVQRPLPAGRHWTVTLVTGDVVQVSTGTNGRQRATVDARRGPVRIATQPNGHVFVLPATMASLVGKLLDPALFDVTELIREGDDDAHNKSVPLIVRGPAGAPLTTGMHQGAKLHALGAVAATMPKTRPIGTALRAMATHHGSMTPQVTGGVRYVWLDRKVHATALTQTKPALDQNLNQIHAPQAWQAGVTGNGVTVAVLDTGIDAAHPDLRGKIVASQDFSGSGNTVDHFGHGTHVAATIAGTGAASGGARKGVAYGGRLLIGKVLGDDGTGDESAIIAGMEWAAPKAKIINMSLGSDTPADGADPMSDEVDLLSKQDHTLFVIAAGNAGPGDDTVSSPGSASTALTVGAVDDKSHLADFSSRGPLPTVLAIKPEIDAPGVDIVEARAAGTTMGTPINADYTMASGTSMATPHVAGVQPMSAPKNAGLTTEEGVRLDSPVVTGTNGKVAVVDYDPSGEDPATIVARAKDAGAAFVAFASTTAGTPVVTPASGLESFVLPVLGVGGADGGRLVTAAKAGAQLELTGNPASAWDDDLLIPLGSSITGAPYVLTPAAEKKLAQVQDHFDAIGPPVSLTRYTPPLPGDYVSGTFTGNRPQPPVQTDYLSPGVAFEDVADIPTGQYTFGYLESPQTYASGSVHSVMWNRRPFFPGPYDGSATASGCEPPPVLRTSGALHVDLAEFRDATDRFDCLAGMVPVRSSLSLTRDGTTVGTVSGAPVGDFAIMPGAATYRLSYDQVTTDPLATDTATTWTFRSTGPSGRTVAQVPILELDYALPLGSNNRPAGDHATFTVNRVHGVPTAAVTSLAVQTSVNGGKTWTTATVRNLGGGRFTVTLPKAAGQWVSLRSDAQDAGGSRIQQTLLNAYQG